MFLQRIGTFLRAACLTGTVALAGSAVAAEGTTTRSDRAVTASGFDWFANGASANRKMLLRRAARRASMQSTKGRATWICSPAGFGQKSRCHRG